MSVAIYIHHGGNKFVFYGSQYPYIHQFSRQIISNCGEGGTHKIKLAVVGCIGV